MAGHAPEELIAGFCDDLYHPGDRAFDASFTAAELRDLAHIYGVMCEAARCDFSTVTEMLQNGDWRRVVQLAQQITTRMPSGT